MLGIPIALAAFNTGEWLLHKYVLHGLGRNRNGRWAFHYHTHHQAVRRNGFYDPAYEGPIWSTPTQYREGMALAAAAALHVPLLPIVPFYASTWLYCLYRYRRVHRRAHLDPSWAREHLRCHYDHHMGDQDKNYGVVWPWVDILKKTRVPFLGTPRELELRPKYEARAAEAAAGRELRATQHPTLRQVIVERLRERKRARRATASA
jgi:sterol desaturase/sphingolipid hydroxylase (fatty acid hydroxylase superfamily)